MRLMDDILHPFTNSCVVVYLDNILIFNKIWVEHLEHIPHVLDAFWQHTLYANIEKCTFGMQKFQCMDYIVVEHGVPMGPAKIQVIHDWLSLKTLPELCNFLGLANFLLQVCIRVHIAWPLRKVDNGGRKSKFM